MVISKVGVRKKCDSINNLFSQTLDDDLNCKFEKQNLFKQSILVRVLEDDV